MPMSPMNFGRQTGKVTHVATRNNTKSLKPNRTFDIIKSEQVSNHEDSENGDVKVQFEPTFEAPHRVSGSK